MTSKSVKYTPVFNASIDEEPVVEHIDTTWMEETAPAEYASASDEYSDYLGCTYRESTLKAIYNRALVWFAREDGDADDWSKDQWMMTNNEDFIADLKWFFARIQAKTYCDAISSGQDGKRAMEAARNIVGIVANSYIDHMAKWNEDIEG